MNIRVEKIDFNNDDVLNFLVNEVLKLYLELNPERKEMFENFPDLIPIFLTNYKESFDPNGTIYAAFVEDDIAGAGFIDSKKYLDSLFVKEEYRNMGIGSNLLKHIIENCEEQDIIRVDANIKALTLYKKFSFKKIDGLSNKAFIPMELERRNYGK